MPNMSRVLDDDFKLGDSFQPDMVQAISGQESDAGIVDYTPFEPDSDERINYAGRQAGWEKDSVYHPIKKAWVKVGSFRQPSREYIEKAYGDNRHMLCWDATYGCFIFDFTRVYADGSNPYHRLLYPAWARPNSAYTANVPHLPIGQPFQETLCTYKYPRFIGYFTDIQDSDEGWTSGLYHIPGTKTSRVPTVSGEPKGEKPSPDAVYDWWEGKWCVPGTHPFPGEIPQEDQDYGWKVWDTALGVYRKPRDWESKNWLDNYSLLIVDGNVSYGGHIIPNYDNWRYGLGIQGDKYLGTRADGEYAAHADAERAKLIKYMKGES